VARKLQQRASSLLGIDVVICFLVIAVISIIIVIIPVIIAVLVIPVLVIVCIWPTFYSFICRQSGNTAPQAIEEPDHTQQS
jgi:uncharacterized membrane protein